MGIPGGIMCFSATASFSGAAVCALAGAMAIRRAQKPDLMIAALPLMLAAHQAIEGYVWLTRAQGCGLFAAYAFATIAFCLWPLYVPAAVYVSETDPARRRIILGLWALGAFVVVNAAATLTFGLDIDFATSQIGYVPKGPYFRIFDFLYTIAVVGPLVVHRSPYMKAFGALVLAFFAAAVLFFDPARFSVWCFFAAISSVVVYLFVQSRALAPKARAAPA